MVWYLSLLRTFARQDLVISFDFVLIMQQFGIGDSSKWIKSLSKRRETRTEETRPCAIAWVAVILTITTLALMSEPALPTRIKRFVEVCNTICHYSCKKTRYLYTLPDWQTLLFPQTGLAARMSPRAGLESLLLVQTTKATQVSPSLAELVRSGLFKRLIGTGWKAKATTTIVETLTENLGYGATPPILARDGSFALFLGVPASQ